MFNRSALTFSKASKAVSLSFSQSRFLSSVKNPKTGVLLVNMGGPQDSKAVHSFLFNLFTDKDLIPLPFQDYLAPFIAKRRTPKIIDQYNQIGGGSPIRMWSEKQASLLEKELDLLSPNSAPHKAYIAFRYAPPLTDETVQQMKKDGVKNAVALTLYPQYSCSTTGSSFNELHKSLKTLDPNQEISWRVVDRWSTHPKLIEAFAKNIEATLLKYPASERSSVILLFSAHSLPMTVVNRGDSYPSEVAATVNAVMSRLNFSHRHRLIWQSQVGPQPWLGPKTDVTIEGYAKQGEKNLLVVPIAFVSDHIETLYEVDIEYGHLAKKNGVTGFKRVDSLNDHPDFIAAMADLVKTSLENERKTSITYGLRCPECVNPKCEATREYFQGTTLKNLPLNNEF
ncbi:hypothetical protein HK096_011339 [Nowakowskiella sp. JEL0078]|nr:hypothetical protein HK096_011339 [Nowakowskiella sp. JEL0078]